MMQRIGVAILIVCMQAGLTQAATNVASQNAVGYVKVGIPPVGGLNLIALNFRSVGGADLTLQQAFGTNQLTKGFVPTLADNVYSWDETTQSYVIYFQGPDGLFRLAENPFGATVDTPLVPGRPLWLASPAAAVTTNEVFLMGEVVGSPNSDQVLVEGLNFFNLPYASDFSVTNHNWLANGATGGIVPTLADNLYQWDGEGYIISFLRADGTWGDAANPFGGNVSPTIAVGEGAWYLARNMFTNGLAKPYGYPED